jgi:hypothetical protein
VLFGSIFEEPKMPRNSTVRTVVVTTIVPKTPKR